MPKRRMIRYDLRRRPRHGGYLVNLAIAPIAIGVNLVASIPGAMAPLPG